MNRAILASESELEEMPQQRRRVPFLAVLSDDAEPLIWSTPINTTVAWGKRKTEGNYSMYQHRKSVRDKNPQLLKYTFRDMDNEPIDLTAKASVSLVAKLDGTTYESTTAVFVDREAGEVSCIYAPNGVGIWSFQFVVLDNSGNPLAGDLAQVKVVKNVDELGTSELPTD